MPGANFSLILPPAPNANQTPKTTSQHSLLTANQTAQPQKSAAAGNLAPAAAPAPNRNDLQCPVRQTASIFKQPVTLVHTTSRETKPTPQNNELHKIHGGKIEKPKQVFWAKRLQGLRAIIAGSSVDLDEVDEELSALPQPARILRKKIFFHFSKNFFQLKKKLYFIAICPKFFGKKNCFIL